MMSDSNHMIPLFEQEEISVRRIIRWVESGLFCFSVITLVMMTSTVVVGQDVVDTAVQVHASDGLYMDRIDIHWNAVDGAAWYEVYRSTFLQHMYIPIAMTTDLSVADKQMQASQYYYYKVRACYETDCGPFSEPDVGSWEIGIPKGAYATRGRFADRVHVKWDRVENATLYYVYRSTHPDELDALLYMGREPSYDDYGALSGKTYFYHVRALTTSTGSALTNPLPGYRDATLRAMSRFQALTESDSD
jgi:fibronectin type 3 domain-containing protein